MRSNDGKAATTGIFIAKWLTKVLRPSPCSETFQLVVVVGAGGRAKTLWFVVAMTLFSFTTPIGIAISWAVTSNGEEPEESPWPVTSIGKEPEGKPLR